LRSNGYSLARAALLPGGRAELLDEPAWAGADVSLADELLRPSVIYSPALAAVRAAVPVHGLAHITGGGIPGNVPRVLPKHCDAVITRGSWAVPRIFAEVQRRGEVGAAEMDRVFNLGVGMVAIVPPEAAAEAVGILAANGHDAVKIGTIVPGSGRVIYQ
jgi:phosphoribosylformylglycinamidine cyclo-ligase